MKQLIQQIITTYKRKGLLGIWSFSTDILKYSYIRTFKGSFSQKGEDMTIDWLCRSRSKGVYVDIGAFHPTQHNNTYKFYLKGWTGINIEPHPLQFNKFIKDRPKDINLNIGISDHKGQMIFHMFSPSALSTFSTTEANRYQRIGYTETSQNRIAVSTLKEIFDKYIKKNIDFMSIDVEGMELQVLKGNNWVKYKPKIICIETSDHTAIIEGKNSQKKRRIDDLLLSTGYHEFISNGLNTIYVLKR